MTEFYFGFYVTSVSVFVHYQAVARAGLVIYV